MTAKSKPSFSLIVLALLAPTAASAHHSHFNLDLNNVQVHTGIVTEYSWSTPHVFLKIMAPNSEGEVVEYAIEFLHPPGMAEQGWTPETFKPGERITWEGPSDRNPRRYFTGFDWGEREDGTPIPYGRKAIERPVVASTDFTGLWKRARSFGSTYAPPPGLPLTELGQAMVDSYDPGDNPQVECKEPGPPRFTILPYPIQITRPDNNTIVITGELRAEPRIVYLDRNRAPGQPSSLGHSVGWFEGEELVVETTNFAPDRWGIHAGLDSSDQKYMIERYSLEDDGMTLKILITVTDPVYLSDPLVIDYSMDKLADRDLVSAPCSLEGAALFLTGYDGN